jgi:hypothetical protein
MREIKVNIYNKDGKLVLKENFKSEKSFSKVYNFRNMAYGTYTMEIINSSTEKVIREIIHESSHKVKVDISSLKEDGKASSGCKRCKQQTCHSSNINGCF